MEDAQVPPYNLLPPVPLKVIVAALEPPARTLNVVLEVVPAVM